MGDFKLQLDSIVFEVHELPEQLPLGGDQQLAVRKFPGGLKSIQALGSFEVPIEWSGEFLYEGALDRALSIDVLRKAGKPVSLSWGSIIRQVIISQFLFQPHNQYWVPYTIRLEVLQEPSSQVTTPTQDVIANAATTASASGPTATRTYTVQPGDTLSKIGQKFSVSWQKIYQANAPVIKNPNLISIGQKLVIPVA